MLQNVSLEDKGPKIGDDLTIFKFDSIPEDEKERSLMKRKCVLIELIETEKDYVENLKVIVEGYMQLLRSENNGVPEDLKNGKEKIIFGNIENIYEWHKE